MIDIAREIMIAAGVSLGKYYEMMLWIRKQDSEIIKVTDNTQAKNINITLANGNTGYVYY